MVDLMNLSCADIKEMIEVFDEAGYAKEEEFMNEEEAARYRPIVAKVNYLSLDRTDLQYSCKGACAQMSRPLRASNQLLKRIGRYLKGRRRCVQKYAFETTR